jgi:hypothetical protein
LHTTPTSVVPLDKQINDQQSLYAYYKQWLKLRNDYPFLSTGKLALSAFTYDGCISFELHHNQNHYLVIHRLAQGGLQVKLPKGANIIHAQQVSKSGTRFQLSAGSVLVAKIK